MMSYKEKLEEAKRLYESANDDQKYVLESLFSELKEDEKIKNQIISFLKEFERDHYRNLDFSSWITWLKRQDEQKLTNNVKPKFKVGDWIIGGIYNKPTQITKIEKEGYVTDCGWVGFSFVEDMRLWTLQDAKDGDVLVSEYNRPFIYNGNRDFCHVGSYGGLTISNEFIVSTSKCFWTGNVSIRPATKEQHDLLFKKMKESGYEWDTKKKRLVDKVEPKFHVGEWLCENMPNNYARFIQILEIVNVQGKERYRISRDIRNNEDIVEFNFVEKYFHKFDIKDAKDGDVLLSPATPYGDKECPFIFKEIDEDGIVRYHVALLQSENFKIADEITNVMGYADAEYLVPATKEQRDTLIKAMADAGYAFDFEKKELKKIDQKKNMHNKLTDFESSLKHIMEEAIECGDTHNLKADADLLLRVAQKPSEWSEEDEAKRNALIGLVEEIKSQPLKRLEDWDGYISWLKSLRPQPKQEWSEEDIRNINDIDSVLFYDKDLPEDTCMRLRNWLESLRDRVQPKQEWGEEDEKRRKNVLRLITEANDRYIKEQSRSPFSADILWLKSLRPQNHWKPTEAQLSSLTIACDRNDKIGFDLTQLLQQLKKL